MSRIADLGRGVVDGGFETLRKGFLVGLGLGRHPAVAGQDAYWLSLRGSYGVSTRGEEL
jgi:hypothetical protein